MSLTTPNDILFSDWDVRATGVSFKARERTETARQIAAFTFFRSKILIVLLQIPLSIELLLRFTRK